MSSIVRHIRQSLSLKLSLLILLMAVPIFGVTLEFLFRQSRQQVREEAVKHASSTLNTTSMRVVRYLNTIEDATNTNAWIVRENFHPDTLLYFSRLVVLLNGNVAGCSITAAPDVFPQYGRYFSAYSVREPIQLTYGDTLKVDSITTVREGPYEYFEKSWYKNAVELGRPCWVDPFDDLNEGTLSATGLIASYCYPLYDDGGGLLGVMATDLSLKKLSELIVTEKPYPDSYFFMLGQDGHYYVHPDSTRLVDKTIFAQVSADAHPDIVALGHEMTTGGRGSMTVTVGGRPCLVCYQPLPGTKWSLALVCPQEGIFMNYQRLNFFLLPILLVGLALILLLIRHIVARFVRPLKSLSRQCQRIADGRFNEPFPRTWRTDTVGRLQNSFATMQQSIDRHVGDIQRLNADALRRNEELQEARQLAINGIRQKTRFMQNMTHQIRTPLNIIMGFAHVLRDQFDEMPSEVTKISEMMNHNAMLLKRMVLMLYDSSDTGVSEERSSGRSDVVSCNELARECIAVTCKRFPRLPVAFHTDLPDRLTIRTNRVYLERTLLELFYNAAKFSDRELVSLRLTKTDSSVCFIFEDKGPGIDEAYQSMMYIPFSKTDDLSEGLGLGLPLSKRHALTLGGDLTLDSNYQGGCRFILELPLS